MSVSNMVFLTGALRQPDILRLVVGDANLTSALLQGFAGDVSVPCVWPDPTSKQHGDLL
ncbi:MAG: hypothetical protein ACI92Z_002673, partial [Paracoccaceae bacterium]